MMTMTMSFLSSILVGWDWGGRKRTAKMSEGTNGTFLFGAGEFRVTCYRLHFTMRISNSYTAIHKYMGITWCYFAHTMGDNPQFYLYYTVPICYSLRSTLSALPTLAAHSSANNKSPEKTAKKRRARQVVFENSIFPD